MIAEHPHGPREDAVDEAEHRFAEIFVQRLSLLGHRPEQHAIGAADANLRKSVILEIKILAVTTLALDAAPERNADQLTVLAIAPLMVDADMVLGVALQFAANGRSAMGAAIDDAVKVAVVVTVNDDRRLGNVA